MKKAPIFLLLLLCFQLVNAQFIKEKSISVQIGYGLSVSDNSLVDTVDDGFFMQGELVLKVASWIELRPYAGVIYTTSNESNPLTEIATSKALLLGGRTRLRAPIPWVAPYTEIGIGTSIGKFETFTAFDDIEKSGFIYHIPWSLGLELGKKNNFDLGFTYYFQPTVEQYAGAVAIGVTFALPNK